LRAVLGLMAKLKDRTVGAERELRELITGRQKIFLGKKGGL